VAKFMPLTDAEARVMTRGELLQRVEAEQVHWHRKIDRAARWRQPTTSPSGSAAASGTPTSTMSPRQRVPSGSPRAQPRTRLPGHQARQRSGPGIVTAHPAGPGRVSGAGTPAHPAGPPISKAVPAASREASPPDRAPRRGKEHAHHAAQGNRWRPGDPGQR